MSSGTGVSFGSEAKSLEPARGLEPTAKPDVQKVDVKRYIAEQFLIAFVSF